MELLIHMKNNSTTRAMTRESFYYIASLSLKFNSRARFNFWQLKRLKKRWKMLFISPYKFFWFLRYLNFCPDFIGHVRKLKLISIMKSSAEKQIITLHILPNISRSKCNQTMKFNQLIKYSMWNIFPGKTYAKCVGETSPKTFSKTLKLSIPLDQQPEILHWSLFLYIQFKDYQKLLKLKRWLIAFTSDKAFLKSKKRSGTSFPAWFLKIHVILYYLTKFHCLIAFTSWDIGQYVYCNYLFLCWWRHKFLNYP